jgi:hypothetical protein
MSHGGPFIALVSDSTFNGTDGQRQLRFRCRVIGFVAFQQTGEREVKVFGILGTTGVGVASQHDGL